jgi:hypothetical protein
MTQGTFETQIWGTLLHYTKLRYRFGHQNILICIHVVQDSSEATETIIDGICSDPMYIYDHNYRIDKTLTQSSMRNITSWSRFLIFHVYVYDLSSSGGTSCNTRAGFFRMCRIELFRLLGVEGRSCMSAFPPRSKSHEFQIISPSISQEAQGTHFRRGADSRVLTSSRANQHCDEAEKGTERWTKTANRA